MRGRGRGRGGYSSQPSLPGLTPDIVSGEGGGHETPEINKLPPPDYPELWNDKYIFKPIEACVGNEPYKARMAMKIQMSSKKSPFYLEPDEPAPEIQTWMNRTHAKKPKPKPSQVINFQENLFPFELLPKNSAKKYKRNKDKSFDDKINVFMRQEKESHGIVDPDEDKEKNDEKGSQSNEEGNEDMQEDPNVEGYDDDDPEQVDGLWMKNDDDSLGEEADSDDEPTMFNS